MSLEQIREQFGKAWQGLGQTQRVALIALVVVMLGALVGVGVWSQTPDYVAAFTGLSQEDAGAIVEKLKSAGTLYQLADGGSTIRVPANLVFETRISLARDGLPQSGPVGFELFSQTNFGMTDFAQKINYQRAMEGELARTIGSLGPVEVARVHLVIPQPSVFTDNRRETTASVLIKVKPGRTLDSSQVQGIRHLISKSVEGLKAGNVAVMDTNGTLLAGGDGGSAGDTASVGGSSDQNGVQLAFEKTIENKVQDMLRQVLGPNKAAVQVAAELDWTTEETNSESFVPGATQGVVRSSEDHIERSVISGTTSGGVPGTQSNFGSVPTYQAPGSGGNTGYEKRDTITNYEVNKTVSKTVKAPGRVKKLSLAVLLDQTLTDAQVTAIKQAASAAAGIDPQRGDTVFVSSLPFDRSFITSEQKALDEAAQKEQNVTIGTGIGMAVAFLVLLFFVARIFRSLTRPVAPFPTLAPALAGGPGARPAALPPVATATVAYAAEPAAPHPVALLAESNPQAVANILQSWLTDSGGKEGS